MSKTAVLGQESWPPDTQSPPHIWITSDTGDLMETEKSIRTEAESHLLYSVIAGGLAGMLVAFVVTMLSLKYCDGLERIGYFPISYTRGNTHIDAVLPMYMTQENKEKAFPKD